jgi:cardiolipin synthase
VPNIDEDAIDRAGQAEKPELVGSHGPLTQKQSKAILDRLAKTSKDASLLERHLAIEQAVAESPLVAGNRTRMLRDGAVTFREMFQAIQSAKVEINLEYYTFEDVEIDGAHLGDLLLAKHQQGVAINVIYDSYGSVATPPAFFKRLKDGGVNLVEFNPVNPLDARSGYALNDRDHRKILVVDGALAIVGGINLSASYEAPSIAKSGNPDGPVLPWRDNDAEIEGPAAAQLQALFAAHWAAQKGPAFQGPVELPLGPAKGSEVVRIIGSTPDHSVPRYYVTVLSAISNAEKSVFINAAYFVPTHQEMEDLEEAAKRGVDVRLLLPAISDSDLSMSVGHSRYSDLLEAGVKIYEMPNVILHSKLVTVDGVWSVIGSSNFDHRSILFNDEVDAVIVGSDTADQLQTMFAEDQAKSTSITLEAWRNRPFGEKAHEMLDRLWQDLL